MSPKEAFHARVLGNRAVVAETFPSPENPVSARVLVKLGFAAAGETERDLLLRGGRRRLLRWPRAEELSASCLDRWRKADVGEDEVRRLETDQGIEHNLTQICPGRGVGRVALDDRVAVLLVPAQLTNVGEGALADELEGLKAVDVVVAV